MSKLEKNLFISHGQTTHPANQPCKLCQGVEIDYIKYQIRREKGTPGGMHTFHACECGNACRSIKCAECWEKDLALLTK